MTYHTYEWTAFAEADLLSGGNTNIGCGDWLTMPASASVCISVCDNDRYLSGDSCRNEKSDDSHGQYASIKGAGDEELGNGGQIYAESYYWVQDKHGNYFVMIEIEQEGTGDDYFTFHSGYGIPPAGADLKIISECNIKKGGWNPDYKCLSAGDKTPDTGSISGTVWCDIDCDGLQDVETTVEKGHNIIKDGNFANGDCTYYNIDKAGAWREIGAGTTDVISGSTHDFPGNRKGNEFAELDCGGKIKQNVHTSEAGTYCLSFDVLKNVKIGNSDNSFKVLVNGKLVETVVVAQDGNVELQVELDAGSNSIVFASNSSVGGKGAGIDTVELRQLIEKTTLIEPVKEGVTVKLIDASGNVVATDTTDANGNYKFVDVPVGEYKIMGVAPDGTEFTIKDAGSNDKVDSDVGADGKSDVITVTKGSKTDIDLGVCEKLPGSLSGRYFCDTNDNDVDDGQGTDPGIGGVLVTLLDATNASVGTTTTAADGTYSFGDLAAGTYSVVFTDPNGALADKSLVAPNDPDGNGDDTNDSDAIGDTTSSTISNITVVAGANTPDNDAGAEKLPGSLSGRYFCDDDRDGLDNDGPGNGIGDVQVQLLDSAGNPIAGRTTTTDASGNYAFLGLAAGTYGVLFTDAVSGKELTQQNVGLNDAIDSDASDLGGGQSIITGIPVVAGANTPDNDAGVFPNDAPEPADDAAAVCATETVAIDALANDSDPNGDAFSIAHINGVAVAAGDMVTLSTGAVVTLNANGTLSYDSSGGTYGGISAADLLIGEQAFDSFTYSVSDTFGATGTATVDIGICGALNTAETIAQSGNIPTTVSFRIDTLAETPLAEAYTLTTSDPDPASASMFDGAVFTEAYCLDRDDAIVRGVDVDANVYVGTAALAAGSSLGAEALGNLDLITWILNQDFGSKDNGDGTNTTYTETEIQAAIWDLVGDAPFVPGGTGTLANAAEIVGFAVDDIDCDGMADGGAEGFAAGAGDILALVLDPSTPYNTAHRQPFVIGVDFDDVDEECVCNLDDFVFV